MWRRFSRRIASPSACRTVELEVSSPNGVVTGLDSWNLCENGEGCALLASFQNAPNSTGPRWSGFQCRFQCASTVQALPVLTVPPPVVGAEPRKLRHIATRLFLVSVAA